MAQRLAELGYVESHVQVSCLPCLSYRCCDRLLLSGATAVKRLTEGADGCTFSSSIRCGSGSHYGSFTRLMVPLLDVKPKSLLPVEVWEVRRRRELRLFLKSKPVHTNTDTCKDSNTSQM